MSFFECHITVPMKDKEIAEKFACMFDFHTSAIAGDEIMGPDARFYLTRSDDSLVTLMNDMYKLVGKLVVNGCDVQRRKIEAIILDER